MSRFQFSHSNKKVKETFNALVIDDSVFVSWKDSKGLHTVEYTLEQADEAILKGDWIIK